MRYALEYAWVLLSSFLLTVVNRLPEGRARKAISSFVTIVIVIVIILAGVAVVAVLVFFPGGASTTTVYPP